MVATLGGIKMAILYKPLISNPNIEVILDYLINNLGFSHYKAHLIESAEMAVIKKIEEKRKKGGCNYGF